MSEIFCNEYFTDFEHSQVRRHYYNNVAKFCTRQRINNNEGFIKKS